jgi:hypothetical protein
MKEVTKEVYLLKWYEDMSFGESLKTNLQYTYNRKSEDFTFIQWSRSRTCRCSACDGLDKRQNDYGVQITFNQSGVDPRRVMAEL